MVLLVPRNTQGAGRVAIPYVQKKFSAGPETGLLLRSLTPCGCQVGTGLGTDVRPPATGVAQED